MTQRKKTRRSTPPRSPRSCRVPGCGRPVSARDLCQTHDRQLRTTGEIKPIRPYRKRSPDTVKFSGLRLSLECAEQLEGKAERERTSLGGAIASVLEDWVRQGARRPRR